MKAKLFSALRIVLFFAIGAVLFWLVIRNQNLDEIKSKLQAANWWWAVGALAFGFLSNIFRAMRWNMLIHPLGFKPKVRNTFGGVMIGYMANLAIPRLGEVMRCAIVNRYEKVPVNKLLGTVVVERVIDVLTIFVLLLVVVLLEFEKMSDFSMQYVFSPMGRKLQAFISHSVLFYVVIVAAFAGGLFLFWFLYTRFRRTRYFIKLKYIIRGFLTGLKSVGQLKNRNLFLFYTFLIWLLYLMMSYICFFCFPATSHLGFVIALAVMVFGGFGWAAPVQGGFGTFHIIVTQTLVLFGVAENDGLAYAILSHATQIFAMLFFGLIILILLPIVNRHYKPLQEN
ncbi:MAG: flippase-like domain-containing protein [Chitinophagales bacterium]|nr:flippase-like domain-containing protein [Bacteroidota bacterium]MBX7142622.1 flippase-like domain-containing protein [Chitinophagales bacterium]